MNPKSSPKYSFRDVSWSSGKKLTCDIHSASIDNDDRTINVILNKTHEKEQRKKCQAVWIYNSTIPYFPLDLTEIFPNLTALTINSCGLTEISRTDLAGLDNLLELHLHNNKLTSLPTDLLTNMRRLKWILLSRNRIEHLDSRMFDAIKNQLQLLDLSFNTSINDCFNHIGGKSIEKFMKVIDKNCKKPLSKALSKAEIYKTQEFPKKVLKGFEDLWSSRLFSDFTIIVEGTEFAVHKNILAMHSEVFKAVFEIDLERRKVFRMTIPGFTASAFEDFLGFLYTGKLQNELNAKELLSLAVKYGIPELKIISEDILINNLDESNVIEALTIANLHDLDSLMNGATTFIKLAYPEVNVNETMMKNPGSIEAVIKAKRIYNETVEDVCKMNEAAATTED